MLNLNELETRWTNYKIKSLIPYIVTLASLIIVVFIISSFDFTSKELDLKKDIIEINDPKTIVKKSIVKIKTPQNIEIETINEAPIVLENKGKKTIINPSMDFMQSIQNNSPAYYKEETKAVKKSYTKKTQIKKKVKKPEKKEIIVEAPEIEIVENTHINIMRKDTVDDIQHVIKRFKKSNNPALSLFVAKKYYELKDYDKAYNYSLITNGINDNIEDSWIIFAKSLVKLDKRDQAIIMLNKYIAYSNSQKAKLLIENIKSGKIQ